MTAAEAAETNDKLPKGFMYIEKIDASQSVELQPEVLMSPPTAPMPNGKHQ